MSDTTTSATDDNITLDRTVQMWYSPTDGVFEQICSLTAVEDHEKTIHVIFKREQLFLFAEVVGDALPLPEMPAIDSRVTRPALGPEQPAKPKRTRQLAQKNVEEPEPEIVPEKPARKPRAARKKKEELDASNDRAQ